MFLLDRRTVGNVKIPIRYTGIIPLRKRDRLPIAHMKQYYGTSRMKPIVFPCAGEIRFLRRTTIGIDKLARAVSSLFHKNMLTKSKIRGVILIESLLEGGFWSIVGEEPSHNH